MERITDKIAALPETGTYFSLEFFPPKTQQGFANLHARLSRMSQALRPLFVNITWGAGGSTATKSLALAELTQRQLGLTTCIHLTCTNMSRSLIDETLEKAKDLGIRNILALRGDPPRSDEYRAEDGDDDEDDSNKEFVWAVDLVRYIRKVYGDYFCIGVAGYPEGHSDQSCPEVHSQSVDADLPYMVEKVQAGADFIMTQLFYDVKAFDAYEKLLRSHHSGAFRRIPIIPGLMPVQSYQILRRTAKLSHAKCPPPVLSRFEAVKADDEAVKRVGVAIIYEMIEHMRQTTQNRPRGFHFYTLNLEKVVAQILERCRLIPPSTPLLLSSNESAIAEEDSDGYLVVQKEDPEKRRRASREASNKVIIDESRPRSSRPSVYETLETEMKGAAAPILPSRLAALAISEGEGTLGREATWDDYPNGRWGDARSPAYGEIDGYGVSLHVSIPAALKLWGTPVHRSDITTIFERYVRGDVDAVPWSEEPLNAETITITDELLALIRKGWWTVASQPAVNCVLSTDKTFGWGPKNGFVYQKAFVEMFIPASEWERLRAVLDEDEQFTYFAANAAGQFEASDEEGVNPVTWGAFTGKEIVAPTIIEGMSFKAWAEEAFSIWKEWAVVYRPGSQSSKLLKQIREGIWLVNIIHHGYVESGVLWETLAGI